MEIRVTRVRKIFSNGSHNSWTGLAHFQGRYYACFSSGPSHTHDDRHVKLIASDDLENWQVIHEVRIPGRALRDPRVFVLQDHLWMHAMHGVIVGSSDGRIFDAPRDVMGLPNGASLWNIKSYQGAAYSFAYASAAPSGPVATLCRSTDAVHWESLVTLPYIANEVAFDFDEQGRLWTLAREDTHGYIPAMTILDPPYTVVNRMWRLPLRMQGPMLARLPGGCVLTCRQWDLPRRRNLRTELYWLPDGHDLQHISTLPSGGDTSYASWFDLGNGRALMTYYSAHEHKMDEPHANEALFQFDDAYAEHSCAADIYLADISYLA